MPEKAERLNLFSESLVWTMLSQAGIAIIACLAYNMLFGQGGMLSFGHAVYAGAGAYLAIHALRWMAAGAPAYPAWSVAFVPLIGGVGAMALAAVLGYANTRKAGTTFAMITLGLAELAAAAVLMAPSVFGGEAGIAGDRGARAMGGFSFAAPTHLAALIAIYCALCTAAMYAFTRTPLGRLLNAVRDNAERVEFVGYSARTVRYLVFVVSAFFMGIAGGLTALHAEIVTTEVLGAARSGAYLLFVVLGGAAYFAGPIVGALLMVFSLGWLSQWTPAWLLYLGLAFVAMMMWAPGGLSAVLLDHWRVLHRGRWRLLALRWCALVVAAGVTMLGLAALVELLYHHQMRSTLGPSLRFLGADLDGQSPGVWLAAGTVGLLGLGLLVPAWRLLAPAWREELTRIEAAR